MVEYQDDEISEEEEQRHRLLKGSGAYLPPVDRYGSAITTLTDPSDDLEKFKLKLKCQRYDFEGKLVQISDPLINEKGINAIMALVESIVHQTSSLTNYNKEYLEILFESLKDDLIKDIMVNRLTYEIDRKNRDIIVGSSIHFIWGFVLKSYEEGERKFWKGSTTEVKQIQEIVKPKGGLSLNPFTMFGRNK